MADRSLRSEARPAPARSAPKRSHDRRAGTAGEDLPTPRRPDPSPSDLALLTAEVETLRVDLDAARARVQELEAKADIDPLLDVFNRRGFERALVSALSYMTRYGAHAALLYVDLDAFKPVNDRHGHAAGDAVLRAVAAALTRNVRASDVVARLGGDEFALLLWNLFGKRRDRQGARPGGGDRRDQGVLGRDRAERRGVGRRRHVGPLG